MEAVFDSVDIQFNVDVFLLLVFFTVVFVSLCCARHSCRQSCIDGLHMTLDGYLTVLDRFEDTKQRKASLRLLTKHEHTVLDEDS